ncbi:START domain containing protein [Acanthamoeba castellanii str. Neff]|uniref:START domain containing protein n=1 Tax=Acanthamoeba castellanii (strain ATCC 30010 / Neff) TaxID=1257118 RepID=L8GJ20_ACACF|nr:START domain containing protein [Acanthamoeba castellanii str. Neff]ELR12849.1 START domain containing protein [Acanthamoeba castellanii str. Neff]
MLRSGSAPALPTETTSIDRATSASRLRIGAGRAATHQQAHLEGGVGPSPCEAYAALIEETFDDLLDEVDLTEEWKLIKEELGVKVSKKTLAENGSVNCMRGDADLQCSAQEFRQLVLQADRWREWDIFAAASRRVRDLEPDTPGHTGIVHITYSAPWPLNSRDVCVVMSSREYEDGTVIVIARSVADDNCPEINGTVRAELLSSGYVITPRDEGGIHVAYILQIDFKGRIPSWITNILSMEMPKSLSRVGKCIIREREQFLQPRQNKQRRASTSS